MMEARDVSRLERCYNVADLRAASRRRLPKWIFEFIDLGSEDFVALAHGQAAFRRLKLRSRAMGEMAGRRVETELLGATVALPAAIAPTGAAGLCWHEGELALARAAVAFGVRFTMAVGSVTPLEKIAAEAGGRLWLQLYIWEDRALTDALIDRGRRSGFEALVVTADYGIGNTNTICAIATAIPSSRATPPSATSCCGRNGCSACCCAPS